MTSNNTDKKLEQQVYRGSQPDGIIEIFAGICLIALAFAIGKSFSLIYLLPILLFGPVLRRLRSRITYPRYGYVKLNQEKQEKDVKGILVLMLVIIISAIMLLWYFGFSNNFDGLLIWLPLIFGHLLMFMNLSIGRQSGLWFYYFLASLSIVSGALLSLFDLFDGNKELSVFFITMGIVTFIFGLVMLRGFLRKYPKHAEDINNE